MSDDTTVEVWRPLGFEGEDATHYEALHEGLPEWMTASFWDWVRARFTRYEGATFNSQGVARFNTTLLREAERVCRFNVGFRGYKVSEGVASVSSVVRAKGFELRLADFLLSKAPTSGDGLEVVLKQSGSAWKVGERAGKAGLVRRVPEGVQVAADTTMQTAGHAGQRLASAWEAAFGVDPDPSKAYGLAIKAVEDAAAPVVSPTNLRATLGTISNTVRDQGNWSLPFDRDDQDYPSGTTLLAMMKTLWVGQTDRHGGTPGNHSPITQEAAEAAVMLAVPLVQWFTSGAAQQRP